MKSEHLYGALATFCMGFLLLASAGVCAQEAASPKHVGVPQDWSDHSLVFTLDGLARDPDLVNREPRIQHQLMQRFPSANSNFVPGANAAIGSTSNSGHHRDWNIDLVRGRVAANMSPAKYTYDPGAPPSCTSDYVVYGLNVAGKAAGQANLIGVNNLYSGTGGLCGAAPTVMFAYNVTTSSGGYVSVSPVISLDGTKIAFVETLSSSVVFHVLTWTSGQGTITKAATPASMTSLTFGTSKSTASSPWVDYSSDTAYVGTDGGQIYKITGVFNGTPALSTDPWWPVSVSSGRITPPVLDNTLGMLMVGSRAGNLYQINITNGAVDTIPIGKGSSIVAAPIVDVTNGTTFIVSSTNGTSAVLVETDTATLTNTVTASIGLGGTSVSIPQPAFTNDYYLGLPDGQIRLCGTGTSDDTPWQYGFGFTGATLNIPPAFSQQLLTTTGSNCTNWTEFYNPNIGGGTDFFFFGLTQDCTGTDTSGCVVAATTEGGPLTTAAVDGGPSGIVVDNYSTAGQASSIYLTAETGSIAYKFTQSGLQ